MREERETREWRLRPPAAGLLKTDGMSGSMVVLVVLMLATVSFDGFTETPLWHFIRAGIYNQVVWVGRDALLVADTIALIAVPGLFLGVYYAVLRPDARHERECALHAGIRALVRILFGAHRDWVSHSALFFFSLHSGTTDHPAPVRPASGWAGTCGEPPPIRSISGSSALKRPGMFRLPRLSSAIYAPFISGARNCAARA